MKPIRVILLIVLIAMLLVSCNAQANHENHDNHDNQDDHNNVQACDAFKHPSHREDDDEIIAQAEKERKDHKSKRHVKVYVKLCKLLFMEQMESIFEIVSKYLN